MESFKTPIRLEHSRWMKLFPFGISLVFLVLVTWIWVTSPEPVAEPERVGVFIVFMFAMVGVPWLIFVEVYSMHVTIEDNTIVVESPWRSAKSMKWIDVESISYSSIRNSILIRSAYHKVGFPTGLVGESLFWEIVRRKIPKEKMHKSVETYFRIRRALGN
jgi:hypothetical protein